MTTMKTIRLSMATGLCVALGSGPAFAMDKEACKARVEQFFVAEMKNCEKLKKEPLNEGKCKELASAEKPKMLKECDNGKRPSKHHRE